MTLQFAILFPIVLTLIFTTVQVALYSYARSVALTAAHRGVNAQRALGHQPNAGRDAADSFLRGFGQPYSSFNPTVTTLNGEVTVIVRGHTESVIPFFTGFDITQSASGPVEEFQP